MPHCGRNEGRAALVQRIKGDKTGRAAAGSGLALALRVSPRHAWRRHHLWLNVYLGDIKFRLTNKRHAARHPLTTWCQWR